MIRLKYCNVSGDLKCITCNRWLHVTEAQAGHYITRDRRATKFSLQNVHPQCAWCNGEKKGQQGLHGIYIDETYGSGTAKMLNSIGGMRGARIGRLEYERMNEEFRLEANRLAKEKGVPRWWRG